MHIPPVNIVMTICACIAGAILGQGVVGLSTKKFLSDPSLPAPEAQACMTLVKTATEPDGQKPALCASLFLSCIASLLSPLMVYFSLIKSSLVLFAMETAAGKTFEVTVPFSPVYIGIGSLLTLSTSLVTFVGAAIRLAVDYFLANADLSDPEAAADWPSTSTHWIGGGAMTAAVIYSMLRFLAPKAAAQGDELSSEEMSLLALPPQVVMLLSLAILTGSGLMGLQIFLTDGLTGFSFTMLGGFMVMAVLMATLGAVLSLQIGSSASPTSGTVFITTLVMCLLAMAWGRNDLTDVELLRNILTGACVAVSSANDSSQDYKTLQLCGIPPRVGFIAQLIGGLAGTIVVPCALYVADDAYGLGTERLIAPQGQMFATLIDGLLIAGAVPIKPVAVGLAIGVVGVLAEIFASRKGIQIPAMAMAVGLYLPAELGELDYELEFKSGPCLSLV